MARGTYSTAALLQDAVRPREEQASPQQKHLKAHVMEGTQALLRRAQLLPQDRGVGGTEAYLVVDEPMVQDAVHVPAEPLQAAILGPDVGVAGGHQPFHCSLQVAQQLPVLFPAEEHRGLPNEHQIQGTRSFTAGQAHSIGSGQSETFGGSNVRFIDS